MALPDDRKTSAEGVSPAQPSPPARGVATTGTPAHPARDRLLAYDVPPASARRSGFVVVGLIGFILAFALTAISHFPLGDSWNQSAIDRTVELDSSSEQLALTDTSNAGRADDAEVDRAGIARDIGGTRATRVSAAGAGRRRRCDYHGLGAWDGIVNGGLNGRRRLAVVCHGSALCLDRSTERFCGFS